MLEIKYLRMPTVGWVERILVPDALQRLRPSAHQEEEERVSLLGVAVRTKDTWLSGRRDALAKAHKRAVMGRAGTELFVIRFAKPNGRRTKDNNPTGGEGRLIVRYALLPDTPYESARQTF